MALSLSPFFEEFQAFLAILEKDHPEVDRQKLKETVDFLLEIQGEHVRKTGELQAYHALRMARLLLPLRPDLLCLQACFLHESLEDANLSVQEVEKRFGTELADLLSLLKSLALVKLKPEEENGELWKKMFLAMAKDLRVVAIKLVDRLDNLASLHVLEPEKQRRIAKESLWIHASVASRLGMYQLKQNIEDAAFPILYPQEALALEEALVKLKEESAMDVRRVQGDIEAFLRAKNIPFLEVQSREKHRWSLFQKLRQKGGMHLETVYDFFAFRVILPDVFCENGEEDLSSLYACLGYLHSEFVPVPDRFKDYVAVSKPNGYRSLHTTVYGVADSMEWPLEIQIRTMRMHQEAEFGLASHWSYKAQKKKNKGDGEGHHYARWSRLLFRLNQFVLEHPEYEEMIQEWTRLYADMDPSERNRVEDLLMSHNFTQADLLLIRRSRSVAIPKIPELGELKLDWLRGLGAMEAKDLGAMIEDRLESGDVHLGKFDMFSDKIFVLTPQRDVLELPKGSTPIDFAYAIHTELGHRMIYAKVNGKVVPFEYELKNGDIVEVGRNKTGEPSRYWLSVAKTSSAKTKIRNYFHRLDKVAHVQKGKELLNRELKLHHKELLDTSYQWLKQYAGKKRSLEQREQILESVGLGMMSAGQVYRTLFPEETPMQEEFVAPRTAALALQERKVLVTGENLPVVFSACCQPYPKDSIVGYVSRGQSIRVHRACCPELYFLESERFIQVDWQD